MNKKLFLVALALVLVAVAGTFMMTRPTLVRASDHDDGETDTKSRNSNLTDVYAFRKGDQTGNVADNSNLIVAFNCNPRSLPRQQYFFSQTARYIVHFGQQTSAPSALSPQGSLTAPSGVSNIDLRFTFGAPNSNGQQAITLQRVNLQAGVLDEAHALTVSAGQTQRDLTGISTNADGGLTAIPATNLTNDQLTATGVNNGISVDGNSLNVFAGLREDPFFFDVTQYFRVRAGALGLGPTVLYRGSGNEVDFTKDYNVLSVVLDIPLTFLQQGNSSINTFDVFATIEQPK